MAAYREALRQRLDALRVSGRDKLVRAVEHGAGTALGRHRELTQAAAERRHQEILDALGRWERRSRRDVFTALDQEAARSSAELLRTSVHGATLHVDKIETLRHAIRHAPRDGLVLEFGVASGATLSVIAQERPDDVFGFDSFEGLPEQWRLGFDAGTFAADALPQVPQATLVVGLFDQTLPSFLVEHPEPLAFVHVDCDLYSSARTILELLAPRFKVGTVLLFDEYYNYPGWQQHEYRAWQEFVTASGIRYEHVGLTMDDEQVSVRLTHVPEPVTPGPSPAAS